MSDFRIIINNDLLKYSDSKKIFSTIYITCQEHCFPSSTWTDFTEIVLGMWSHNLIECRYSQNINFEFPFMDGAYRMDVEKDNNMQLTINCINSRGNTEMIELTVQTGYYEVLSSLYDAYKSLNYFLYCNKWHLEKFKNTYNHNIILMNEMKEIIKQGKMLHEI